MKNFRETVFKRTYEIMNQTGKTFSKCLAKAWKLYRLVKKMVVNKSVSFAYRKKDGSYRIANGTLEGIKHLIKGTGKVNHKSINYYDNELKQFRSFQVGSLITIF